MTLTEIFNYWDKETKTITDITAYGEKVKKRKRGQRDKLGKPNNLVFKKAMHVLCSTERRLRRIQEAFYSHGCI